MRLESDARAVPFGDSGGIVLFCVSRGVLRTNIYPFNTVDPHGVDDVIEGQFPNV